MAADCIYILANASMPGLFKVGVTTKERLTARARELYSTGVPTPFAYVWHKETLFAKQIERRIKSCAPAERYTRAREFYRADVPTLIRLIEEFDNAICATQNGSTPEVPWTEAGDTLDAIVDNPNGNRRYHSFWSWCEVTEGADGRPIVLKRGLRNPVADLNALSPLPYPVRWIIVDVVGAGGRDIDVDLRVPEQRQQHGPWIAGTVLGACLEISSDELPITLVEQHRAMGFAAMDWIFQRAFEQLAEQGFQFGESPDFWVVAWAWARRLLGNSDREVDIPPVSSFPSEWLGVQARPIPAGPTRPLVLFSGSLFESHSNA